MKKYLTLSACLFALQACTFDPHVEDWKRHRITEIPDDPIEVSICFNHQKHSKQTVYDLAREECGIRITEVQNLVQHQKLQKVTRQTEAEGRGFEGSVERSKRIQAMVRSLKLNYIENDKWDCPLMTPNRITFQCSYSENATESAPNRQTQPQTQMSPDLPPELPDDLKPN
ncbi:hypothetical protein RYZ26_04225 [Terasakiella sp. A23]|uniref:hypothetical protein n=1 Tax=Terasakiella sp. FCG-A23 TaxID=3080561 RepID=UPI002953F2CD|nr:hypothetical protein [Terasakiella sp. A23]MDV7338788.1 hypothetical protein [Terasakiella sp. A23]